MTLMGGGDHYILVELNLPYNNASNQLTMYKYVNLYMCVGA